MAAFSGQESGQISEVLHLLAAGREEQALTVVISGLAGSESVRVCLLLEMCSITEALECAGVLIGLGRNLEAEEIVAAALVAAQGRAGVPLTSPDPASTWAHNRSLAA